VRDRERCTPARKPDCASDADVDVDVDDDEDDVDCADDDIVVRFDDDYGRDVVRLSAAEAETCVRGDGDDDDDDDDNPRLAAKLLAAAPGRPRTGAVVLEVVERPRSPERPPLPLPQEPAAREKKRRAQRGRAALYRGSALEPVVRRMHVALRRSERRENSLRGYSCMSTLRDVEVLVSDFAARAMLGHAELTELLTRRAYVVRKTCPGVAAAPGTAVVIPAEEAHSLAHQRPR
jgi:hypothetical protein